MSSNPKDSAWHRASNEDSSLPDLTREESSPVSLNQEGDVSGTKHNESSQQTESPDVLKQASRFLEDSSVRDAPSDKKVAFLKSKGVSAEDIKTLLGASEERDTTSELQVVGERAWSTVSPKPTNITQPTPQPREIPPIVTYPEFLTSSEKPPPLMTTGRLLNTAYITGGLMAGMYGLSKYIIGPMAENLAASRHDFASHTREQLQELNKRLGDAVSVDPTTQTKTITDVMDDISEADSDPTELYHRDYGTQTTPNLSRRSSLAATNNSQPAVVVHENRLKSIKSMLNELETRQTSHHTSQSSLKTKVSDLTTYLSEVSYQNQHYSNMNGFYGSNYGLPSGRDGKNDQIDVFKNDIRAVKGVLLSARNFPTGGTTLSSSAGRVGA